MLLCRALSTFFINARRFMASGTGLSSSALCPANLSDQNDVVALCVSSPMGDGVLSLTFPPGLW